MCNDNFQRGQKERFTAGDVVSVLGPERSIGSRCRLVFQNGGKLPEKLKKTWPESFVLTKRYKINFYEGKEKAPLGSLGFHYQDLDVVFWRIMNILEKIGTKRFNELEYDDYDFVICCRSCKYIEDHCIDKNYPEMKSQYVWFIICFHNYIKNRKDNTVETMNQIIEEDQAKVKEYIDWFTYR